MENKREILMISLKTAIEWLSKQEEILLNIKKWFVTVWTTALGFSISNHFYINQSQIILLSVSVAFSLIHLVMQANKYRELAVLTAMEKYLLSLDENTLKNQKESLSTVINTSGKIKRFQHYFCKSLTSWQDNLLYYIGFLASIILPYLLKK
ncbi:MAG TPA: hypothetical protein VN958_11010 [Chitinophagaceae bacterium]|nr:hypothetical protein [Chitinophagaceae bacterium]